MRVEMRVSSWQESVVAARASGDTEALAHGMAAAAGSRIWDGRIDEALTYLDAAIRATEALGRRAGAQLAPQLHRGACLNWIATPTPHKPSKMPSGWPSSAPVPTTWPGGAWRQWWARGPAE
jgi:hypothetical protein